VSSRSSFVRAIKPGLFPGPRTNTVNHPARRWSHPYGEAVQSNHRFILYPPRVAGAAADDGLVSGLVGAGITLPSIFVSSEAENFENLAELNNGKIIVP
jgi:hypothetical protein